MRINKFVAAALSIGRRQADKLIHDGEILVNGQTAETGHMVTDTDTVTHNGTVLSTTATDKTILLHKPIGYVCSRDGQGSKTIYDLLPKNLHALNPAGRLDKNTSGLLVLTTDGKLIEKLTHPRYEKSKSYNVTLHLPVTPEHIKQLLIGVTLGDGPSRFDRVSGKGTELTVVLHEGRKRQIRRTFHVLGYNVVSLHRTHFGPYQLDDLKPGQYTAG